MLRAFVMSILGWRVVVRLRSTSIQVTPRRARSCASVMPTGPPPAMRTWVRFIAREHSPSFLNYPVELTTYDLQSGFSRAYVESTQESTSAVGTNAKCSDVCGVVVIRGKDGVIGRPSLWIAEDFWVLRFRLMVKRGP